MRRILVIDDDPAVTSVLRRGLSYEGFAVQTAQNGRDGLDLAREQAPDLVVLDVMKPGLDGHEVLQRLRVADPRLPAVLLTAKDQDGSGGEAAIAASPFLAGSGNHQRGFRMGSGTAAMLQAGREEGRC